MNPYIQTFITFIISIFLALFTSRISHRFFYKQELWLRKEKRYSDILDSLSILLKHYADLIDESIGIKEYNYRDCKEVIMKAQQELERLSMMPSFIIDKKVLVILKALFQAASDRIGNEREGDYFSYYERVYGEIKQSIEGIDRLARKDLKV